MRIRVALAASNHVAMLSIYLSSYSRKGIRLKFIATLSEEIYIAEGAGKKIASFLSHEIRVSGACHGVMLRINGATRAWITFIVKCYCQ